MQEEVYVSTARTCASAHTLLSEFSTGVIQNANGKVHYNIEPIKSSFEVEPCSLFGYWFDFVA